MGREHLGPLGNDLGLFEPLLLDQPIVLVDQFGQLLLRLQLHGGIALEVLSDRGVVLVDFDHRTVLVDEALGVGDRLVHPPQQVVARRGIQAGGFDLPARFLQHGQRHFGVFLEHPLGFGLVVSNVGEDLLEQCLLGRRDIVDR